MKLVMKDMETYVDFERMFVKLIEKHKKDPDYELIKDYPVIFSIISKISADKNADGFAKLLINCTIAYFVLPTDIISEKKYGLKGYIDDFFVCLHALIRLREYDEYLGDFLIKKHWSLEEDYRTYIVDRYYQLMRKIDPKMIDEILTFSGISFIDDKIFSKKKPKKYSEIKIKYLQRKIKYMFYIFFQKPLSGRENRKLFEEQFFGTDEFKEFVTLVECLEKKDSRFEKIKKNTDEILDVEEMIKAIRIKRLLK